MFSGEKGATSDIRESALPASTEAERNCLDVQHNNFRTTSKLHQNIQIYIPQSSLTDSISLLNGFTEDQKPHRRQRTVISGLELCFKKAMAHQRNGQVIGLTDGQPPDERITVLFVLLCQTQRDSVAWLALCS